MKRTLDIHTAELTTAAVEVKTLTIRGKQVTLAVFRQLEERPLVLEDGTLAGLPWGRVNYHPGKCADCGEHMHIVWQLGDELRRARVDRSRWWANADFYADGLVDTYLEYARQRRDSGITIHGRRFVNKERLLTYDFEGVLCGTSFECDIYHVTSRKCSDDEFAELRAEMLAAVTMEKERRKRIDGQWEVLGELPQLFIAV